MTGELLVGVTVLGAFVFAILFLAWSLLLPKFRAIMSTALVADCAMGLIGTVYFFFSDRIIGAIFLAACTVGFSAIAGALWIRPATTRTPADEIDKESQSKVI